MLETRGLAAVTVILEMGSGLRPRVNRFAAGPSFIAPAAH